MHIYIFSISSLGNKIFGINIKLETVSSVFVSKEQLSGSAVFLFLSSVFAALTMDDKSLVVASTSSLAIPKDHKVNKKKKRKLKVLEEEVYVEKLSSIVERDYFPDLKALREQNEVDPTEDAISGDCVVESEVDPNLTLDKFVNKYTSEDNASFEEMIEEVKKKEEKNHPWLFKDEEEGRRQQQGMLTLPSVEEQAAIEDRPTAPITWPFTNLNTVMYHPEGAELTEAEKDVLGRKPQVIKENTRFQSNPFNSTLSKQAIKEASISQAQQQEGKIGPDGKIVSVPIVSGYSIVPTTPVHVPSTPLMTWGEIEGTPKRLDPSTPGDTPHFRLPDVPAREALGHSLAERVAQRSREKKRKALEGLAQSTKSKTGTSAFDKLAQMSPAAQRLAANKLGITPRRYEKLALSFSPRVSSTPSTPIFSKSPAFSTRSSSSKGIQKQ